MRKCSRQLQLLKNEPKAYGGDLLCTRKGRAHGRPLATRHSMHLVLRSSKAVGPWSFRRSANRRRVEAIVKKFSQKYGVRISSIANVGNHLHLQIQLTSRHTYRAFIRAITGAIAMAITGTSRWTAQEGARLQFWDRRPFTRVVMGIRALLALRDYIRINRLEGFGYHRSEAEYLVKNRWQSTA